MTLPQIYPHTHAKRTPRQERREMRYPLHLPVLVRMARKEMRTRSENISLGGILLASDVLIPEGTAVEVVVGVQHLPDPGVLLSALGTVLRVQRKDAGDYGVAIRLERSFELPFAKTEAQGVGAAKAAHLLDHEKIDLEKRDREKTDGEKMERQKTRPIVQKARYVVSWQMET